jgi:hypothetical protein
MNKNIVGVKAGRTPAGQRRRSNEKRRNHETDSGLRKGRYRQINNNSEYSQAFLCVFVASCEIKILKKHHDNTI